MALDGHLQGSIHTDTKSITFFEKEKTR